VQEELKGPFTPFREGHKFEVGVALSSGLVAQVDLFEQGGRYPNVYGLMVVFHDLTSDEYIGSDKVFNVKIDSVIRELLDFKMAADAGIDSLAQSDPINWAPMQQQSQGFYLAVDEV
jgi:hypothetical protein